MESENTKFTASCHSCEHAAYLRPPWSNESTVARDWTFHQIAPYIGRMKTSMARSLLQKHTSRGDLVVDPFCGCGVVGLEAAASGRRVIVGDWNPYAVLLTRAKLFPPATIVDAESRLRSAWRSQVLAFVNRIYLMYLNGCYDSSILKRSGAR